MLINGVSHWLLRDIKTLGLPEKFIGLVSFELSGEDIDVLFNMGFDISIRHVKQVQPSKKQQRQGSPIFPDLVYLWLDDKGGGFRHR